MTARKSYDQDVQPNSTEAYCPVAKGVVGWKHTDEHHDLGTSSNDGHTFVRVTLFVGKHVTDEPVEGQAHGLEILCKVMGPLYWVPPKGTPVLVAFPDGEMDAPGSAVILGSIGPSPGIQFKGTKPKLDFGPDQDLVIKAKSLTLSDYNDNFIFMGTPGIKIQNKDGTGVLYSGSKVQIYASSGSPADAKQVISMSADKLEIISKDNGFIRFDSSGLTTHSQNPTFIGSAMVLLGKAPGAVNPVLWGVSGPAGVPSASVFVSPI